MSSGEYHSCIQGKDSRQAWMVLPLTLFNSLHLEGIFFSSLRQEGQNVLCSGVVIYRVLSSPTVHCSQCFLPTLPVQHFRVSRASKVHVVEYGPK